MTFPTGGTEYGGHPGRVQPAPHDPENRAHEMLHAIYATDPGEATSEPSQEIEKARAEGRGRLGK